MLGLFISNLNCLGFQEANGNLAIGSGSNSLVDVLRDYSIKNVNNLAVKYYNEADVDPKASHNFMKYLAGDSLKASVVKFPNGLVECDLEGFEDLGMEMSLKEGAKVEFASSMPDAKYLVCPHFSAEYCKDGEVYDIPLIIKIESLDADSGLMTGSLVTGRYDAESESYHLDGSIEKSHAVIRNKVLEMVDNIFYALSDIPDLSEISKDSKFNVFVLQCDCPAIREDAKKGDVFVFGQSEYSEEQIDSLERVEVLDSWIKLYSLEDKIDAFLKEEYKKITLTIDGKEMDLDARVQLNDLYLSTEGHHTKEMMTTEKFSGNTTQGILPISPEDAKSIYIGQELVVEGVNGYQEDGRTPSENTLKLLVVGNDIATGMPVVRALNGSISAGNMYIPFIPAESIVVAIDNRPSLAPSVVLSANDMHVHIKDSEYDFREGEVFAVVNGNIYPIEFDAIASQFNSED